MINMFAPSELVVVYVVTHDNFNGSPWLPTDHAAWVAVDRDPPFTKWRGIFSEQITHVDLAANGVCSSRRQSKR